MISIAAAPTTTRSGGEYVGVFSSTGGMVSLVGKTAEALDAILCEIGVSRGVRSYMSRSGNEFDFVNRRGRRERKRFIFHQLPYVQMGYGLHGSKASSLRTCLSLTMKKIAIWRIPLRSGHQ